MMNCRSNSYNRFIPGINNNNNYIQSNKTDYNSLNEELKQTSDETNLINGVDENLNLLLTNLKYNSPKERIYYPLNSKIRSPMKIHSSNKLSDLNLVDAYNSLIENNSFKSNDYLSSYSSLHQNHLSGNSTPYSNSFLNRKIINNSNIPNKKFMNNNSNTKEKYSYNGYQINNKRLDYFNNNANIPNQNINCQSNMNAYKQRKNFSSNNINKLVKNKNNQYNRNNNLRIIQNNSMNFVPPSNKQINKIMKQLKELNLYNAQNKKDIFSFQEEYFKLQKKILSSLEALNISKNINNNSNNQIKLENLKNREENNKKEINSLKIDLNNKD